MTTIQLEEILALALKKINKRHFEVTNPKVRIINETAYELSYSKIKTQPENNFACYIIAHYLVELDNHNFESDEELTIFPQAQLYKRIEDTPNSDHQILIKTFNFGRGVYPDIVFHKSQNTNDTAHQYIIIECKISTNLTQDDFSYDFAKLIICKERLNFQKALYIIANNNEAHITDLLSSYKSNHYFPSDSSGIEIWIKNYDKELIKINCC